MISVIITAPTNMNHMTFKLQFKNIFSNIRLHQNFLVKHRSSEVDAWQARDFQTVYSSSLLFRLRSTTICAFPF
jgi:hypothetical protein